MDRQLIARRSTMMQPKGGGGGLPSEYQRVEYLSTVDNEDAFIRTTLCPTSSLDAEVKFSLFKLNVKNDQKIFGVSFAYGLGYHGGRFRTIGSLWVGQDAPIVEGEINIYKTEGIKSYCNDYIVDNNYRQDSSQYITLFSVAAQSGMGTDQWSGFLYLYYAKFFNNAILSAEFVPCYRKSDNKPGMYDLCGSICPLTNSPFYINAGAGEFNVGPDVI